MDKVSLYINEQRKTIVVLELVGKLDVISSPVLDKKIAAAFQNGDRFFILDMGQLEFITSSGIRVLIAASKKCVSSSGKFILANLGEQVLKILTISGIVGLIPIYQTKEEAFRHLLI